MVEERVKSMVNDIKEHKELKSRKRQIIAG